MCFICFIKWTPNQCWTYHTMRTLFSLCVKITSCFSSHFDVDWIFSNDVYFRRLTNCPTQLWSTNRWRHSKEDKLLSYQDAKRRDASWQTRIQRVQRNDTKKMTIRSWAGKIVVQSTIAYVKRHLQSIMVIYIL